MQNPVTDLDVRPQYYTTSQIQIIMGCCGNTARAYARMFEARRQALRQGRAILVPREVFDRWRREQDGSGQADAPKLHTINGGKSENAKLKAQIAELQNRIEEMTRPKKRGRPPGRKAASN